MRIFSVHLYALKWSGAPRFDGDGFFRLLGAAGGYRVFHYSGWSSLKSDYTYYQT